MNLLLNRRVFLMMVVLGCFQNTSAQVVAAFTANSTSSCDPLTVTFTDQSSGNVTSWSWDFGNNQTSSAQNPTVNYTAKGNYTVKLTVNNGSNSDTETKVGYISIFNKPIANYSLNPNTGCAPLTVNFTDLSSIGDINLETFKWDFGDGSLAGTDQNPIHTYQAGGKFPVSLEVTDSNGCKSAILKDTVKVVPSPIANFSSYNKTDSCGAPYTVRFRNTSQGTGTSYKWDFGDGSSSTEFEPQHTFASLNRYTITLIASNTNCSDTLILKEYVRLESPTADFTPSVDSICVNDTLEFSNLSTQSSTFDWDFGDTTYSSAKTPRKVYDKPGLFEVELIASNNGSSCFSKVSKFIYVSQVIADFAIIDTFSCFETKAVGLIDQSMNADSLAWFFNVKKLPDTIKSFIRKQDSQIEIDKSGKYTFTQVAKNRLGCADTLTLTDSIELYNFSLVIDYVRSDSVKRWDTSWLGPPAIRLLDKELIAISTPSSPRLYSGLWGGCLPFEIELLGKFDGPTNPISWSWNFWGINQTSNIQNPLSAEYTERKYDSVLLTVVDDSGCVFNKGIYIMGGEKQTPGFSIEPFPANVCYGDTIFLNSSASDKKTINFDEFTMLGKNKIKGSDSDSTERTFFVEFPDTGMFAIQQIVEDNGCPDTLIKQNQFYSLGPIIDSVEHSADDCTDRRTVKFTSSVIDATGFEWDFGDGSPVNTTDANPTHTFPRTTRYWTVFKAWNDDTGCDTLRDSTFLNLVTIPPLTILPENKNLCPADEDTIFIEEPHEFLYVRYLWKINGDSVSTKRKFFRFFDKRGTYIVELETEDFLGCVYTTKDTFFISRPTARIGSNVLEPCYPLEIEFYDNSERDTTIDNWYWEFGFLDTSIQEVDTRIYSRPGRNGVYLRVENIFGCADSVFVKDFLNNQVLSVSFLEGEVEICEGDTVMFRNVSSGVNPIYNWDFGDGTTFSGNDQFVTHVYNQAGSYTVTLTGEDGNGCKLELSKPDLVLVDSKVTAGFTADTTTADCYPLPVFFTDTSKGEIAEWEWRFGDGASSILQNPFHNYTQLGGFDVFLKVTSANGCSDSIFKPVYIETKGPSAEFTVDKKEACVNIPFTFTLTTSENVSKYSWDFGDGVASNDDPAVHSYSSPGIFYPSIILSDLSGNCVVEKKDTIEIYNVFADFSINDDSACVPLDAVFINESVGENSIFWDLGNGMNSTDESPTVEFTEPGSYEVSLRITSDEGCFDTAYKKVVVLPPPNLVVTPNTGVCFGDSVLLTAQGGFIYTWTPTDFLRFITNDSTYSRPGNTITYSVTTEDRYGCEATDTVEVFVVKNPFNSDLKDTSIVIGESVDLDVLAGDRLNYQWSPTEWLSCPDCPNPNAAPLQTQTYVVNISDDFGCFSIEDTINIEIIEVYSLDVPKAFSPNGDGVNDIIYARGWGLKELLSFKIYNRFGELVFESNRFENGWDGNYRNEPQNIETYIYTVEALTFGNRLLTKKGNITLLR